ncbi:MAG: hypothetical protein DRR08_25690 [Candidatus Parabeggiatoa sp. nov. 2]|nr:MAG: hypothetical protein B6247_05590 [Beggiatoa sp. 4572_84]RKZ54928.1 MAG: hypothetical protein DRR08_25690 [Gammaproteobacteria bacterium]
METESSHQQELQVALDAFIQTATMEDALEVIQQHPALLSDQADLLLSSIIDSARKQGHESTAQALDERRYFIRNVRQEQSEKKEQSG